MRLIPTDIIFALDTNFHVCSCITNSIRVNLPMEVPIMLVTKKIQMEFASTEVRAIDHISDIRKAAEYAGVNLYSRYGVQLQYPMPTKDNKVVVEIKIPEEIVGTFKIGKHLRGISKYLCDEKRYGDDYKKVLVGNRLLNYIEISPSLQESSGITMADRLEAIVAFTRLLERSDDEALDQINRIFCILKEAR